MGVPLGGVLIAGLAAANTLAYVAPGTWLDGPASLRRATLFFEIQLALNVALLVVDLLTRGRWGGDLANTLITLLFCLLIWWMNRRRRRRRLGELLGAKARALRDRLAAAARELGRRVRAPLPGAVPAPSPA